MKLIGKEVIGNFGASWRICEGVIVGSRVSDDFAEREVLVNWDYGDNEWLHLRGINKPEYLGTANGSPIGIFWKSVFFEK